MKQKKIKEIPFLLIAIISCLCVFSFGFSSFIIGIGNTQSNGEVNFKYGDVVVTSDYLSLNTAKGDV